MQAIGAGQVLLPGLFDGSSGPQFSFRILRPGSMAVSHEVLQVSGGSRPQSGQLVASRRRETRWDRA